MGREAFVTGSHKYGTPHEKSDFDLVVFLEGTDLDLMRDHFTPEAPAYGDCLVLRFGELNLICFCSEHQYNAWRAGTQRCHEKRPVDRDFAVAMIGGLLRSNVMPDEATIATN